MFLLLFLVILGISYGSVLLISTTAAYLMHKPFPSLCPYTLPFQVLLKTSSVLKHSLMSLSHSITSIQSFPSAVPWDWVLDPNCPQTSSEHLLCGEAKTFVSGMLSFFLLWVIIKDDSSQQDYLQMTWKQGELVLTALLAVTPNGASWKWASITAGLQMLVIALEHVDAFHYHYPLALAPISSCWPLIFLWDAQSGLPLFSALAMLCLEQRWPEALQHPVVASASHSDKDRDGYPVLLEPVFPRRLQLDWVPPPYLCVCTASVLHPMLMRHACSCFTCPKQANDSIKLCRQFGYLHSQQRSCRLCMEMKALCFFPSETMTNSARNVPTGALPHPSPDFHCSITMNCSYQWGSKLIRGLHPQLL